MLSHICRNASFVVIVAINEIVSVITAIKNRAAFHFAAIILNLDILISSIVLLCVVFFWCHVYSAVLCVGRWVMTANGTTMPRRLIAAGSTTAPGRLRRVVRCRVSPRVSWWNRPTSPVTSRCLSNCCHGSRHPVCMTARGTVCCKQWLRRPLNHCRGYRRRHRHSTDVSWVKASSCFDQEHDWQVSPVSQSWLMKKRLVIISVIMSLLLRASF